jgi:hypothetical protein
MSETASRRPVSLRAIDLPEFGISEEEPRLGGATYRSRLARARRRMAEAGLDRLLVWGDREHHANLAYLTGYDPRFEEALLILAPDGVPRLLVGLEGWAYATLCPIELERVLYQPFGLLGQPRDGLVPLETILAGSGIGAGTRIGVAGWKYRETGSAEEQAQWHDAPAYLIDLLRRMTGGERHVVNAGRIFADPATGLRAVNEVEQLAVFEHAACVTSTAMRDLIRGIRPGMTEYQAVQQMRLNGMPLSVHLMLSSGPRAAVGLGSPSSRRLVRGEYVSAAYGVWGALNARGGFLAAGPEDLAPGIRDYVAKLVAPYFAAVVEWYETLAIGLAAGRLHEIVQRHLGDPFFGIGLNPGHLIHLEEWLSSPVQPGSEIPLASGMALQCDIIPATGTAYMSTNIEDGVALADTALREAFAADYPEAWRRIEARRAFMTSRLGIRLAPEVLPFSNIPAWLPPFLLSPGLAMTASAA